MAAPLSQVFFPAGFPELFSAWNRFPDSALYAGGTGLLREQGGQIPTLPKNIICLNRLEELHKMGRTERYLEIGAMVKLSRIVSLGKIVPEPLIRCIQGVASPELRNLATIGGNLCDFARRLDCSAPMIALDAQYELRTAQSTRWIAASRFSSLPGPPALAQQELLTRIRVPLENWTYTRYRKFNARGGGDPGEAILFIMRNQKNILANIRVVYSGKTILREKTSESMLAGKRLPLEKRDAAAFVESWKAYLSMMEAADRYIFPERDGECNPELAKAQIMNFIKSAVMSISE